MAVARRNESTAHFKYSGHRRHKKGGGGRRGIRKIANKKLGEGGGGLGGTLESGRKYNTGRGRHTNQGRRVSK